MKRKVEATSDKFFKSKEKKIFKTGSLNKRFKLRGINNSSDHDPFDITQGEPNGDKHDLIERYEYFANYFKELNKNPSLTDRRDIIKKDLGRLIEKDDFFLDFCSGFYLLISQVLNEKKQPVLAAKFLKKSLGTDNLKKEDLKTLIAIGDTLIDQKSFLKAEKILRIAFNSLQKVNLSQETKETALLLLVNALMLQKKFKEAYQIMVNFELKNIQILICARRIGDELEKLNNKIERLFEMLNLFEGKEGDKNHLDILKALSVAYIQNNDFESAEEMIDLVLSFEVTDPIKKVEDIILKVNILEKKGDFGNAEIFLYKVIHEYPDVVSSAHYLRLGKILKQQNKFDEAEKLIRPIAFDENIPAMERENCLSLLSKILERKREFAQAQEIIETAIGMTHPEDPILLELQMRLGKIQSLQKKHPDAKESFKKALYMSGFFQSKDSDIIMTPAGDKLEFDF